MLWFVYKLPLGVIGIIIAVSGLIWAELSVLFNRSRKFSLIGKFLQYVFLAFSIGLIIYTTFANRDATINSVQLQPFYSFELAKTNPEMYRTMLMNVLLFVPFGIFLSDVISKQIPLFLRIIITLFAGVILSSAIEFLQYRFSFGKCEIDDIFCNSLGVLFGSTALIWKCIYEYINIDKCIIKYLSYTFSISWLCWCILAVLVSPEYNFHIAKYIANPLHIIGGFGPVIAIYICNKKTISLENYFKLNKASLKCFLIFAALELVVFGLSSLELNPSVTLYFLPLVYIQAVFIYGGNEELGWRGYLQPKLEKKFSFGVSSIFTGLIWSVWHLPLWFVDGASQQSINFGLFLILGVFLSFWLGALYRVTKNTFCCALLHGLTNTVLSIFVVKISLTLILGLIVITAFSIYIQYRNIKKPDGN